MPSFTSLGDYTINITNKYTALIGTCTYTVVPSIISISPTTVSNNDASKTEGNITCDTDISSYKTFTIFFKNNGVTYYTRGSVNPQYNNIILFSSFPTVYTVGTYDVEVVGSTSTYFYPSYDNNYNNLVSVVYNE